MKQESVMGWWFGRVFLCLLIALFSGCAEEESTGTEGGDDVQDNDQDVVTPSDVDEGDGVVGTGDGVVGTADVITDPVACKDLSGCDDGNPCTIDDYCLSGVCVGTAYDCDDGVGCTHDLCDGVGGCTFSLKGDTCRIAGVCFDDGEAHPDTPCLACVVPVAHDAWSADDNLPCDDGDECSAGEGCHGGVCGGGSPLVCDDGELCTDDECDGDLGCVFAPNDSPCNDGNPCSIGDVCSNGGCIGGGAPLLCDDGNPCTDDTCAGGQGCVFVPNAAPCEDDNPCTLGDVCGEGICVAGSGALACDDGNPCTTEGCDSLLGCTYTPNAVSCNDGNVCTLDDACAAGSCSPGETLLACDDGNLCTDDYCHSLEGCQASANAVSCDDGNECTLNDACSQTSCVGGSPKYCDDGNLCTDNFCSPDTGCVYVANSDPCNDGFVCTTGDGCEGGQCTGEPVNCDDGNACTLDVCNGTTGGCDHTAMTTFECIPQIVINSPERGISIQGPTSVTVTGTASSGGGPFTVFTVNGIPTDLDPDGSFSQTITPVHGMNLIIVEAADVLGGTGKRVQSFYYSTEWTPIDFADPAGSYIQDGIALWLGQLVVDDGVHDLNDIDDLATIFELVASDIDFGALFDPNVAVASQNVPGLGDVDIYVKSVVLGDLSVALLCIDGGLHLTMVVDGMVADLEFKYEAFWTQQTATGTATASSIVVDTDLFLSVNVATGEVVVNMGTTDVTINNLDVTLDGVIGFLTNWIINFFEADFATQFEDLFADELANLLPDLVSNALESLALNTVFDFPPLFGGDKTVTVSLDTSISSLEFTEPGGEIGLFATAVAEKDQTYDTLGSIGRASCLTGEAEWLEFQANFSLQIGLHDDLFNQLLYNMWWGGGLTFTLDESVLDGFDLASFGISDLKMDVAFMLPPIITSCNSTDTLRVQMGDLFIHATLNLGPIPLEMDVYTSLEADASLDVVEGIGGQELGLALSDVTKLETDIIITDPSLIGFKDVIAGLIEAQLIPTFLDALSGGAIGGFPLPAIDLSIIDGVPPGTQLELDLNEVIRTDGYTLLMGEVK